MPTESNLTHITEFNEWYKNNVLPELNGFESIETINYTTQREIIRITSTVIPLSHNQQGNILETITTATLNDEVVGCHKATINNSTIPGILWIYEYIMTKYRGRGFAKPILVGVEQIFHYIATAHNTPICWVVPDLNQGDSNERKRWLALFGPNNTLNFIDRVKEIQP